MFDRGNERGADVTIERAENYRRQAEECLAVARTVSNPQGRATLEALAQIWFRLADQQTLRGRLTEISESQAAMQQQQQPHSDGGEDKE
jgi:hypothetical protein